MILYQLEAAARRLRDSLAAQAPCCLDSSSVTLQLLHTLLGMSYAPFTIYRAPLLLHTLLGMPYAPG